MPEASPIDPVVEWIDPIADSLEALRHGEMPDVRASGYGVRGASAQLANAYTVGGMGAGSGSAGRREMLRRWLQFCGLQDVASEVDRRLGDVLHALRDWERMAKRDTPPIGGSWSGMYSRPVGDAFEDVADLAGGVADYFRQLTAMLKVKRLTKAAHRPPRPLSDRERAVLDLLRASAEPLSGKQICAGVPGLIQGTLTRHIIPALHAHGVCNRPNVGYYVER